MVSLVNTHPNATRIGWHLWEIDLRFAPGLPPGWESAWEGRRRGVGEVDLDEESPELVADGGHRASLRRERSETGTRQHHELSCLLGFESLRV